MLRCTRRTLLAAFALAACAGSSEPADPFWGKQACDTCRMLVSDPHYAAQLVDARGRRRYFDDIGCLDAYLLERSDAKPVGIWVRQGPRWVVADSARYVAGAPSPMAYGFEARELGPLDFAAVRKGAAAHRRRSSP